MKYVYALLIIPVYLFVVLVSLPWLMLALGLFFAGYEEDFDHLMETCPMGRLIEWTENH